MPNPVCKSEFMVGSLPKTGGNGKNTVNQRLWGRTVSPPTGPKPLVTRSDDRKKTHLPHRERLFVRAGKFQFGFVVGKGVFEARFDDPVCRQAGVRPMGCAHVIVGQEGCASITAGCRPAGIAPSPRPRRATRPVSRRPSHSKQRRGASSGLCTTARPNTGGIEKTRWPSDYFGLRRS
jgi:hypothetical protein